MVQADGTVEIPAQTAAVSSFLSPEAKAYLTQHLKDMQDPEILKQDAGVPRFMKPYIARDHELFAVDRKDEKSWRRARVRLHAEKWSLGEKQRPSIDQSSRRRVHRAAGLVAQNLNPFPVSALGQIEVVSVDYREGPDYKFPAASEDVASVYQQLLKNAQAREHWYLRLLGRRDADRDVDRLVSKALTAFTRGDWHFLRVRRRCIRR